MALFGIKHKSSKPQCMFAFWLEYFLGQAFFVFLHKASHHIVSFGRGCVKFWNLCACTVACVCLLVTFTCFSLFACFSFVPLVSIGAPRLRNQVPAIDKTAV
ncbi:hypothetical protein HOLleu_35396 [Holothuria leucospilota]|uniref:Uncharacterized protein n=1 Tax=Holothuria leucospilota TaxID=206669 RepID=A0A9Q0YRV2_HOLLE|nr:hypothetical protein HOLleu_35396 [Holothuria leucospilota]